MGWGTPFASAWNAATDTVKAATKAAAQTAKSAYDYTAKKAVQTYDYSKAKAVEGARYVKDKAVEAAVYTKNKAVEAGQKAYQLGKSAQGAVAQGLARGAIGARYLQALGPAGTAKLAYDKARETLGLNKAGSSVKDCPKCSAKCAKLQDALEKAQLAKDSYAVDPATPKEVAGYRRLDSKADKAELSRLLGVKNPERVLKPGDSDFRASVYKRVRDGKTEYVMAFRGTQTKEDWMENLAQGAGQVGPGKANPTKNQSYSRAMKLATKLSSNAAKEGADVSFTGHSLGGGMASAAAVVTGRPASTYNAAGLHPNTVGGTLPTDAATVDAYFTPTDFLNGVQDNGASAIADFATSIASTGAKVPWIKSKMIGAGVPEWAISSDVAKQEKAPQAYGSRHPLPFPNGHKPPPLSGDGIVEGHSMPLVIDGIKQQQEDAKCN